MPHPMRDVVVVVPGIMGSVLRKDRKDVWAPSGGAIWNFFKSRSGSLRDLALAAEDDGAADDLGDGVTATGLMPDVHFVPGLWGIDGYTGIRDALHELFELRDGHNYFEFPYDWRRNNLAHGRRLRTESAHWLADWKTVSGNDDAKLVIVAHSMGGLVARSFLELEDGWSDTSMLITFGTPFAGSLNALNFIANGFVKGFGPAEIDLSDLLRSLTSVYQLLPTFPCVQVGDDLRTPDDPEAKVPNLEMTKAANAAAFHRRLTEAASAGNGGPIYPIVGIRQPTLQRAVVNDGSLWVSNDWDPTNPALSYGGDGTVPRRSAIPDEMYDDPRGTVYSAVAHGSLQSGPANLAHIEGVLTERQYRIPRPNAAAVKYLSLDVDDYFHVDEDISIRLSSSELGEVFGVTVTDLATGAEVASRSLDNFNGEAVLTTSFPELAEGSYRITVEATTVAGVPPVSRPIVVWA